MPIKFHKTTKIFHLYNQDISYIFKILKKFFMEGIFL